MEFDENFIEEVSNAVFEGATFAYRDTCLSENRITKYSSGMIIMERGFVDSSAKGGGIPSNLRYLIISSQNKNMPSILQDFGLCTISNSSYFKVIDVFSKNGKTQITLLHIPERAIEFFATCTTNFEESIVEQSRENFLAKIELEPVPELEDKEWVERVKDPLGMDDNGNFFKLTNV